eukprot:1005095_1
MWSIEFRENKDLANDVADQIFTKYDTLVILKAILALKDTYFDLNHQKDYKTPQQKQILIASILSVDAPRLDQKFDTNNEIADRGNLEHWYPSYVDTKLANKIVGNNANDPEQIRQNNGSIV